MTEWTRTREHGQKTLMHRAEVGPFHVAVYKPSDRYPWTVDLRQGSPTGRLVAKGVSRTWHAGRRSALSLAGFYGGVS